MPAARFLHRLRKHDWTAVGQTSTWSTGNRRWRAVTLSAGRPVIAGYGGSDLEIATLVRLQSDLILADGCGD